MWAGISSSLGAWVRQERKEEGPGWSPQGGERKHGSTASHPLSPCILTRWAAFSTAHPQCHDILPLSQAQSNGTKWTEVDTFETKSHKESSLLRVVSVNSSCHSNKTATQKQVWSSLKAREFGPDTPLTCCSQPGLWGTGYNVFLLTSFKSKDVLQCVLK